MQEALRLTEEAHRGQTRKGTDDVPYIVHPMAVAIVLARVGAEEDLLLAALLHDVAEDTAVGLDEIQRRFGARVAAIVAQLTKPPQAGTSAEEVVAMLQGEEAVWVKSADLIVNLGDLVIDAEQHAPAHLRQLFRDPPAKLSSYLRLAELLIERLGSQPGLRRSLVELHRDGEDLLAAIEL